MNDTNDDISNRPEGLQERFVFKHTIRFGNDVEYDGQIVDVTALDSPEEMLDRVIFGFMAFLENQDFESTQIFDRTIDILMTARIRQENPSTFGKKISVSSDQRFETFLKKIRNADVDMLKELYNLYTGKFSLN